MKTKSNWLLQTVRIIFTIVWYLNFLLILIGFTMLTLKPLNWKFGTGNFNDFSDLSTPVKYVAHSPVINMDAVTPNATQITLQPDQYLLKLKLKTNWGNVAISYFFFIALEVLIMTIIYQLRKFFDTIKQNAPFKHENIRRLKITALCFALLTPLNVLLGITTAMILNEQVKNAGAIHIVWSESFIGLILGAVIYIMADIFSYGFNLQKENEEFV
ncbi:MAG: DUF2975 domain-containing protein [Bacteroidota bacterium]